MSALQVLKYNIVKICGMRTVWMKHVGLELDDWSLVRVLFCEHKGQLEGACMAALLSFPALAGGETPRLTQNAPPSHGVSSGPNMTALQCIMLSGFGDPFTPCGGSC